MAIVQVDASCKNKLQASEVYWPVAAYAKKIPKSKQRPSVHSIKRSKGNCQKSLFLADTNNWLLKEVNDEIKHGHCGVACNNSVTLRQTCFLNEQG